MPLQKQLQTSTKQDSNYGFTCGQLYYSIIVEGHMSLR